MSYIYIKDFIKNTVLDSKDVVFGVENIFELRKKFSNDIVDDEKLRTAIRNALDELSSDSRFTVILDGRKSICFNHNCTIKDQKESNKKDKKDKQYFWFVCMPLASVFPIIVMIADIFFDKVFLAFALLSFLAFFCVLFHNEYISNGNTLSNQISLTVPIFGFIYYVLNDPVFSKYSYLSLDSHILSNNNLYSIAISLFLALFILMTANNKLIFLLSIIFIILFPFTKFIMFLFLLLVILLFYILKKYNRKKEFEDVAKMFSTLEHFYKSKNYFYILIYGIIATLFLTIINSTDAIKRTYYKHLSEDNAGFCKNLNYGVQVIKSSSKNGSIVIYSENLFNEIIFYLFTQSKDIEKLDSLDNDVTLITYDNFIISTPNLTYNSLLLKYKENPDLVKEQKNRIENFKQEIGNPEYLKDFIMNNNEVVNYYLKYSNVEGNLFFYNCD